MKHNIHPCLWFNGNGKEAATFYCSLFSNSGITVDTPLVVNFKLHGQLFMALNGGPQFQFNPSISFFVVCNTDEEINKLYKQLVEGGKVMMPLEKYDWSERYAFLQDQFGVAWQLMKVQQDTVHQKITPCFLFVGDAYGKAESAVRFYTKHFPHSKIEDIKLNEETDGLMAGSIKYSQFKVDEKVFIAMDGYGAHVFAFNEAISFVVECDTQAEIDFFWNTLTADGGEESMCGWLKDKFGVSWQIIPKVLGQLMNDSVKAGRVMQALLKMKKINIADLETA